MNERYPRYDVLAKRHTLSWNEKTRQVIDERLALPREPRCLSPAEWLVLEAVCDRIHLMEKGRIVHSGTYAELSSSGAIAQTLGLSH